MAKKKTQKSAKQEEKQDLPDPLTQGMDPSKLTPEAQKKLKDMRKKLDKFQKKTLEKFKDYIMGIALLPPPRQPQAQAPGQPMPPVPGVPPIPGQEEKPFNKDEISVLVLVDDNDSKNMSKWELKEKLSKVIEQIGKDVDPNIATTTLIISEIWQNCFDAKYDLLPVIAMSAPIYDKGMLNAIKISEIHKNMVLKKFEKYIVSYVLAGSLVQGKATATSDIDVWVVIDDTDVKKMTRIELKDKLRAIILGMGIEAGQMTGIKNKLNIQVYILTDFWDSLKEANPVIFTLLRDGVPFYDRGIFMPWKQLLQMGKIKPSPEAIELFMNSGTQVISRVHMKLKEIGMEDTFWSILTPSQAALMLYGVPPPTPRETPELLREIFVKKEKLLEDKYVKILENNIKLRKDLEHGTKKEVTGKDVDKLLSDADDYLKRIKKLFEQIQVIKDKHESQELSESLTTIIRDVLKVEGIDRVTDVELVKVFENELISTGKIPAKYLRLLNDVLKFNKSTKKVTKPDIDKNKKSIRELIKVCFEYLQRKRGRELERAKIRVKYGDNYGEAILLGDKIFITHDIDAEEKEYSKANVNEDGSLGTIQKAKMEELEKAIANLPSPMEKVFIKEKIFEDLKKVFGGHVEILVNY